MPIPMRFGLRLVARRPRRAILNGQHLRYCHRSRRGHLFPHRCRVEARGPNRYRAYQSSDRPRRADAARDHGDARDPRDPERDLHHMATVLDARRVAALMRVLGVQVRQVSGGRSVAQVLAALPGAVVGVLLGVGPVQGRDRNGGGAPMCCTGVDSLNRSGAASVVQSRRELAGPT